MPIVVRRENEYTLRIKPLRRGIALGTIITIRGVGMLERATKLPIGRLREFVVTRAHPAGDTRLSHYPPITPRGRYRNVTRSPEAGALVKVGKSPPQMPAGATVAQWLGQEWTFGKSKEKAMPLKKGTSKASFSKNVATERKSGKSTAQSVAIAYSVKRKAEAAKRKR
jgi:hypothetical protein